MVTPLYIAAIKGANLIVWNVSSSIVNTGPLKVLIIQVYHCNLLVFSNSKCFQHAIGMILVSKEA